jgi:hypothetical protein
MHAANQPKRKEGNGKPKAAASAHTTHRILPQLRHAAFSKTTNGGPPTELELIIFFCASDDLDFIL